MTVTMRLSALLGFINKSMLASISSCKVPVKIRTENMCTFTSNDMKSQEINNNNNAYQTHTAG